MPQGEWLSSLRAPGAARPGTLYTSVFLLALAAVSALGWFGWKLVEQERLVETQRQRDTMEQAADSLVASLRGVIADQGDRLAEWNRAASPVSGPVLRLQGDVLDADHLLYYPSSSPLPEAPAALFLDAELAEFAQRDLDAALRAYRPVAASPDPAIRAGALLREARIARKRGRLQEARSLYQDLASLSATISQTPVELIANHALCELGGPCEPVRKGLLDGRWRLTQGQFEFYWSSLAKLEGKLGSAPPEKLALATIASRLWDERGRNPNTRGQETVWMDNTPYFILWRGSPDQRTILVARADTLLSQVAPLPGLRLALTDAEGRTIAGERAAGEKEPSARGAVRAAADSQLPWTLFVTMDPRAPVGTFSAQQRFLLISLTVMVIFLIAGTYFITRAIRQETETMRMQSDFISAVSHEFRTPLTSIRHLSELLVLGRVPSEERRKLYHSTLLRESSRLERLVEGLLNFGRMEAGARQYHFEEIDAASLANRVVTEFAPQMEEQGRRIELSGAEAPLKIEADPEAIRVALRNLVENAIKYSPGKPSVWVDCGLDDNYVAIRVRDHGPGIPDAERRRIFRRFVRGSAALSTNAKGSGVGLAMVRHIIAAHGGEIKLTSEPGQGSVFTILLPEVKHA